MNTFRTFIAAEVADPVLHHAERVIRRMRDLELNIKWVDRQQLHLTLVFLGDIWETNAPDVCRAAQAVAAESEPFSLEFQTLGAFPNTRRPRIVWMGTGAGSELLAGLQGRLASRLDERGIDFDHRPFHSHLTLGRLRQVKQDTASLAKAIERHADQTFGVSQIQELVVYCSELERSGPVYTVMARAPLGRS